MLLQESEYEVEHCFASRFKQADALSRIPECYNELHGVEQPLLTLELQSADVRLWRCTHIY